MYLRSPAEYYIKYLLVHPDKYDTAAIKKRLLREGLDFISAEYIADLRADLRPPTPFYPEEEGHLPSLKFVIQERIQRMFQRTLEMKMALELLRTPRAKEFAEAMLLVQVPLSAIASFITRNRGVYTTPAALELYQHYFWNVNLLDSTQWRVLLQMRVENAVDDVPAFADKKKVLMSAYYKDPRKVAADMPFSPTTATLAQMRLGMKLGKLELSQKMMELRDIAVMRAVEAAHQDGPGDSQKFLNYITGSRILEELLQMVVKPEDEMRAQLQSIALRTNPVSMPSVHQLTGGNHTVDVAPLKDLNHDDPPEYDAQPQAGQRDGGAGADS
jgi:hypothetical protein